MRSAFILMLAIAGFGSAAQGQTAPAYVTGNCLFWAQEDLTVVDKVATPTKAGTYFAYARADKSGWGLQPEDIMVDDPSKLLGNGGRIEILMQDDGKPVVIYNASGVMRILLQVPDTIIPVDPARQFTALIVTKETGKADHVFVGRCNKGTTANLAAFASAAEVEARKGAPK